MTCTVSWKNFRFDTFYKKFCIYGQNTKYFIFIISKFYVKLKIQISGFSTEILDVSKICGNRIPLTGKCRENLQKQNGNKERFMVKPHTSDIRMRYEYIRVTYGWHTSTCCFGLFTKIKKGSGISFWCTFSVWFFFIQMLLI